MQQPEKYKANFDVSSEGPSSGVLTKLSKFYNTPDEGPSLEMSEFALSPSRRREAPCEGTNSPRLFTPGETKALAKSKVHQISRAWVTNRGWSSSLISKIWRTVMNSEHCDWSNLKYAL